MNKTLASHPCTPAAAFALYTALIKGLQVCVCMGTYKSVHLIPSTCVFVPVSTCESVHACDCLCVQHARIFCRHPRVFFVNQMGSRRRGVWGYEQLSQRCPTRINTNLRHKCALLMPECARAKSRPIRTRELAAGDEGRSAGAAHSNQARHGVRSSTLQDLGTDDKPTGAAHDS